MADKYVTLEHPETHVHPSIYVTYTYDVLVWNEDRKCYRTYEANVRNPGSLVSALNNQEAPSD